MWKQKHNQLLIVKKKSYNRPYFTLDFDVETVRYFGPIYIKLIPQK